MERAVGEYLLIEKIGRGSLGETFLAEHCFLKRPYILKLLAPELRDDPAFIARFEAGVQKLSQLEHPHIARVHSASRLDEGFALISEPILNRSGYPTDLGRYVEESSFRVPEEIVLDIALQLASALDFAHNLRVAHGGIKLSNVAIKETPDGIQAYFTDWGLSSILGPLAVLSRTYHQVASMLGGLSGFAWTSSGEERYAVGPWDVEQASALQRSFCETFFFLAPEQKVANHPKANPLKSDLYAFGTLLYYLLTAQFPEGRFELPSERSPGLKKQWDSLICCLLHPDPERRPSKLLPAFEGFSAEGLVRADFKPALKPQEIKRPAFDADPGAIFQTEIGVAPYRPEPQSEIEIQPLLTPMAIIPGGNYVRGSNSGGRDEMPRHTVVLEPFAIDIHPVTNEQFVRFLEAIGGEKDANNSDLVRLRDSRLKRSGGKLHIESGYSHHPVVGVTWYGAVAYAKWVGKRLPTEAEWEVAACGGKEDSVFPSGNTIEKDEANFFSSDTTAVKTYRPNGYGLYDMAGNIYEWCQDWYDYHYYDLAMQEPYAPKGPAQGVYRVLRGGCWKSSKEDLRCAHRHRNNPGTMNGTYGFRCAADVIPSSVKK